MARGCKGAFALFARSFASRVSPIWVTFKQGWPLAPGCIAQGSGHQPATRTSPLPICSLPSPRSGYNSPFTKPSQATPSPRCHACSDGDETPPVGRLETELVVPPPHAVPPTPRWETWLEPSQGFGDQKRTDAPSTSHAHPWQRCPEDAWWEPSASRLCAGVSVGLPGPSSIRRCGAGGEGGCRSCAKCRAWGGGLPPWPPAEHGVPVPLAVRSWGGRLSRRHGVFFFCRWL